MILLLLFVAHLASADMGFYPLNSSHIPPAVQAAGKSVYQVLIVDGSFETLETMDMVKKKIASLKDAKGNKEELYAVSIQLKFCQDHNLIPCFVAVKDLGMGLATGFVAGKSNTLWVNFHVVHEQVSQFMQWCLRKDSFTNCLIKLKSRPLMVALFDDNDKGIFFPSEGDFLTIESASTLESAYRPGNYLDRSKMNLGDQLSDVVKLSANRDIAEPLQFADKLQYLNRTVYLIGYPDETKDRQKKFNKPDAPGDQKRVSSGRLVTAQEGQSAAGNPIEDTVENQIIGTHLLQIFADSVGGNSGSPILSEKGEVLGILTESDRGILTGTEPVLTMGLSVKRMLNLEAENLY